MASHDSTNKSQNTTEDIKLVFLFHPIPLKILKMIYLSVRGVKFIQQQMQSSIFLWTEEIKKVFNLINSTLTVTRWSTLFLSITVAIEILRNHLFSQFFYFPFFSLNIVVSLTYFNCSKHKREFFFSPAFQTSIKILVLKFKTLKLNAISLNPILLMNLNTHKMSNMLCFNFVVAFQCLLRTIALNPLS